MRKIWTIISLQLKGFFKSPGAIVLMFIMPVLFSLIFGGMVANSEVNKPLVNIVAKQDENSTRIVELLKKNNHFEWKKVPFSQAKKNVAAQDAVAAVVIPPKIQQRMIDKSPLFDIIVQRKTDDYLALYPHLQGTAELIAASYQAVGIQGEEMLPKLLEAVASNQGIKVEQQLLQADDSTQTSVNLMIVGFAIMFMMFGLSGAASTILDERIGGTWGRLMVSPASKLQISFGYLLSYFFMGWIQLAVLMVVMNILFDTTWGNLANLIPFASLVIITVVGFGLMIAGLVKTKQQASAISAVLIVSTCMLGGVYWPIDFVPELMQKLALAVPQSWAMSGFKEIISGSLHVETLLKDTLALLGFSCLFFFIGLRGIKFE
jgi:ABC-2 type transport system permease protein